MPDPLKRAMLTHIALMFAHRGALSPEQQRGLCLTVTSGWWPPFACGGCEW